MVVKRRRIAKMAAGALFALMTAALALVLAEWAGGRARTGAVVSYGLLWGAYSLFYLRLRRRGRLQGMDLVWKYLGEERLAREMEGEQFQRRSRYFRESRNWLWFQGQYVPKNFVIGAYAFSSMDEADHFHLALITGDTCSGLILGKDTLGQLELLRELLPHADTGGSGFVRWWGEHREELARRAGEWAREGRDLWPLVYHWSNLSGWDPPAGDGRVDDSEEYFRDYPEERPGGEG